MSEKMRMAMETAREIANVKWRVEKGGRYSVASQNIAGIIRGTIMNLAAGWERSQAEIARLQAENESLKGEVVDAWITSVHPKREK